MGKIWAKGYELDALKAVPGVGGGVLLIVLPAENIEAAFEDGMQIVPSVRIRSYCRSRRRHRTSLSMCARKPIGKTTAASSDDCGGNHDRT